MQRTPAAVFPYNDWGQRSSNPYALILIPKRYLNGRISMNPRTPPKPRAVFVRRHGAAVSLLVRQPVIPLPARRRSGLHLRLSPNRLSAIIRVPFSSEFTLAALMCGGAYKANPTFAWMFPIDPTFIYCFYGAILLLWHAYRHGIRVRLLAATAFFLIFQAWMIISLFWSPVQSLDGLPYFITRVTLINGLIFFLSAVIIARSEVRVQYFLWISIALTVPLAIEYVLSSNLYQRGFLEDRNYSIIGRMFAVSAIVGIGFTLPQRILSVHWLVFGILSGLFTYASLLVGSRQSFIAIGVALFLLVYMSLSTARRHIFINKSTMLLGFGLALLIIVVFVLSDDTSTGWTIRRLSKLFEFLSGNIQADDSAEQRLKYLEAGLYYWTDSLRSILIGDGLFSFSQQYRGVYRVGAHPHNLIVYILCEFGIIGLILFLGLCVCLTIEAIKVSQRCSALRATLLSLVIALWFRAVVAGDIVDSFVPLVFLVLLTAPPRSSTKGATSSARHHADRLVMRPGIGKYIGRDTLGAAL